jgi:hypothetical protein
MWFRSLPDTVTTRPGRAASRRARRPAFRPAEFRPRLEALEDRWVPSFTPPVNYPAGLAPHNWVAGDFNGNGKVDLAVLDGDTVKVLLGNGDGTFQAARTSPAGFYYSPQSMVAGDFNGDGRLDVVVILGDLPPDGRGGIHLLPGNGDGTFGPGQRVAFTPGADFPASPVSVAAGDLNGDGKLDLVVTWYAIFGLSCDEYWCAWNQENYLDVLLGQGDGTFRIQISGIGHYYLGNDYATPSVALGDVSGDGRLDVLTVPLSVWLANGDGTFQPRRYDGFNPSGFVVADLNGDGKADLVTRESVRLSNGDGTFQDPQWYASGIPWWQVDSVAVADINRDGAPDLVAAGPGYIDPDTGALVNNVLAVFLGNGDGSFGAGQQYAGVLRPSEVVAADFNADGFPDLAVTEPYPGNNVSVLLNDGSWPAPAPQASRFVVSGFPSPITAGTAGTFTVTAKLADGTTATGYTGTVHFTSSDGQAGLPADYTFTAADQGVHTFSAILKTAGTQSLTATDRTSSGVAGSQGGITVAAAAASRFTVAGFLSPVTAGVAGSFTITARDPYGNRAIGYTGTVRFTSSDAKAVIPGSYTFTATDAGAHTFSAVLKTAGTQSLTATDIVNAAVTGAQYITVNPAAASRLLVSAPASVKAGARFSLTVTAVDAYGNVVTGYRGTIAFRSSDSTALLPENYTFTAADRGVHPFTGLMLKKKGKQTITVTDTLDGSLTASVSVDVR